MLFYVRHTQCGKINRIQIFYLVLTAADVFDERYEIKIISLLFCPNVIVKRQLNFRSKASLHGGLHDREIYVQLSVK